MASARAELVRERITRAAERRDLKLAEDEAIASEIKKCIADARKVKIPMSEVARLLHMDRTSLYRTYINGAANGS